MMYRKVSRRKLIKSATTAAAVAVLYGTAGRLSRTFGASSSAQLFVQLPDDMDNLDPARIVTRANYTVANAIYSSLVKYDPYKFGVAVPDLAERWQIAKDGRTYTFWL